MPEASVHVPPQAVETIAPAETAATVETQPSPPLSIALENVSKVYRLYPSPVAQMIDVLGLDRFMPWRRASYPEFPALDDVTLTLHKGERVGIVGRNGAGKTTLLKLITGNFRPSKGTVRVEGRVQALMQVGLGFHPEFTGRENIRSSLLYNGLSGEAFQAAVADVIDFVELGEFLDQPLKTYSLGMSGRLQFAAATAIQPEILIVDEVLGAGDAYFSAKSAERMERFAESGCTLLLVSHSMAQVLQFCERAIWLENGRVILEDAALTVVKAYEEFTQKLQREAEQRARCSAPGKRMTSVLESRWLREKIIKSILDERAQVPQLGENVSPGGISRWQGERGLKISNIRLVDDAGDVRDLFDGGEALNIEIEIVAEEAGEFDCSYVILLFTEDGRWISRHCSDPFRYVLKKEERKVVKLRYDEVLLGNGKYIFSAAIYKELYLEKLNASRYYDLLARSFQFEVKGPDPNDISVMRHPARWIGDGKG